MTVRGTLGLAALLALLLGYLLATHPPPLPPDSGLLAPSLAAATTVEIVDHGHTIVVGARDGGFDDATADLLLALQDLRVLAVIAERSDDPTTYGFGSDAARLRVLANDASLLALDVGAANPAGTGVYVRRTGDPAILLVGALLRWELDKVVRAHSAP